MTDAELESIIHIYAMTSGKEGQLKEWEEFPKEYRLLNQCAKLFYDYETKVLKDAATYCWLKDNEYGARILEEYRQSVGKVLIRIAALERKVNLNHGLCDKQRNGNQTSDSESVRNYNQSDNASEEGGTTLS